MVSYILEVSAMRIAVCDDECRFITDFKNIMNRLYNSLDIIVDAFSCGSELLKSFSVRPYDLVFLDIEMPGMDGLTLAGKLRSQSEDVCIVFLTGHIEYAIKGYEVGALRYLTKPADENKVREVIEFVLRQQAAQKLIWIRTDEGDMKLRLTDIVFIEAKTHNVIINTASDSFSVRGNISDYECRLTPDGFFRIHRGYLIALSKVVRLSGKEVIMEDGTALPIGRSYDSRFKDALFSYMKKEAF